MADHETSKLDKANHLLLEQPLLRLPFELLRKNLQSARFTVEKEREAVKNSLKETTTAALNGRVQPDDVLQNLDAMIARMRGIKRKMSACADEEARIHRQVNARTAHLSVLAGMHTLDDVTYEHWSRQRLDRLIVDYMLRQGYNHSARRLAEEKKIEDLVDVETFVAMSKIQDSLRAGSVTEALAWCIENKKELRKMEKGKLEFILRYQQYLDLVRTQEQSKLLEAIIHAKKYLVPFRDTYPEEVNRAAGLLAFSPREAPEAYAEIWSPKRWDTLAKMFTETHNQLLALPTFPLLHTALSSGLSALKTPACHAAAHQHDASGSATGSVAATASLSSSVCPICSTELNALARNVPYAHHSKSHVDHDLLLLPNGRVYGKGALDEHAVKAGLVPGQIKDLRTGDVYPADTLKKVFIT